MRALSVRWKRLEVDACGNTVDRYKNTVPYLIKSIAPARVSSTRGFPRVLRHQRMLHGLNPNLNPSSNPARCREYIIAHRQATMVRKTVTTDIRGKQCGKPFNDKSFLGCLETGFISRISITHSAYVNSLTVSPSLFLWTEVRTCSAL